MSGLDLAERYFESCRDALSSKYPGLFERMAIGLIGHGSQCLGFDDEVSRDHDWGPQFCVFLEQADFDAYGRDAQKFLKTLPAEFEGFPVQWDPRAPRERSGVLCTQAWFYEQLGVAVPFTARTDWLKTSDPRLLWATNGEIWHDPLGYVSKLRRDLAYYPSEVWLTRVANKCLLVQILGPYQIGRALSRGDTLLPFLTRGLFVREALHLVFLLNRRYAPVYKWLIKAFEQLPHKHGLTRNAVEHVLRESDPEALLKGVQEVTRQLHMAVQGEFPDTEESADMLQLGYQLASRIEDPAIQEMQFWNQELVV